MQKGKQRVPRLNPPPLHIVFTMSGAGALRAAISESGGGDRVICLPDPLNFGPVNPPDPELRRKWVEEELGWTD
jgi:hypothetical protein